MIVSVFYVHQHGSDISRQTPVDFSRAEGIPIRVADMMLVCNMCASVKISTFEPQVPSLSILVDWILVSIPDSHVHPPEKRVWPLSKWFF